MKLRWTEAFSESRPHHECDFLLVYFLLPGEFQFFLLCGIGSARDTAENAISAGGNGAGAHVAFRAVRFELSPADKATVLERWRVFGD